MKWTIVGFKHPEELKSLVYKQEILEKTLLRTIEEGIRKGCNLFSIRGGGIKKEKGNNVLDYLKEGESK